MKELSVEEKAKRYDEAIQRARQFMETPYLENSDDVVGFIFPELKESEGERIRKGIESIIKHYRDEGEVVCPYPFVTLEEALAWLEKQGEQKPAWSEEDEERLSFCCAAIELSNYSSDEYRNYAISFLESLKDRVQPQPKQEWSEEDERNLNDAILFIETGTYSLDKDNLINWLKSLRPQNTWKPSERDLGSLTDAIIHYEGIGIKPNGLKELLEQLKKLKEE